MAGKGPCYGCEKRYPGCHGKCEDYKEWRSDFDAKKNAVKEEKMRRIRSYPSKAENKNKSKLTGEV